MRSYIILSVILSFALLFTGCDDVTNSALNESSDLSQATKVKGSADKNPVSGDDSILEIAASNEDFSILAQAVVFAGLDEALNAKRQLTVFAPTNDAFVALLDALGLTAEELFVEENKELVRNILLGNEENGFATITATDIFASNGVIHVIDAVLLPADS